MHISASQILAQLARLAQMTIGFLLLALLIVGVVLALFPVDGTIRNIILAVIVIAALVWLFSAIGIIPGVRFR